MRKKILKATLALAVLIFGGAEAFPSEAQAVSKDHFAVRFGEAGVVGLKRIGDAYDTEYILKGETLGHLNVRYRMPGRPWKEFSTRDPKQRRDFRSGDDSGSPYLRVAYNPSGWDDYYADLEVTEGFRIEEDALYWTIHFRNLTHKPLELGDVAIELPFNEAMRWDKTITNTLRVTNHAYVSGHGSFAFWMRPNGEGPFLAMTPVFTCPVFESSGNERNFKPAKLEYSEWGQYYIHAAAKVADAVAKGGSWNQPVSSAILSPKYSPNDELTYDFKFRWADGYEGVRDVLVEEGLFDVQVVPGMTVPIDLEARVAIRTKTDYRLEPEFPASTEIKKLAEKTPGIQVYAVKFAKLGENNLTLRFGRDQYTVLEFFVTEPLETVIKKRAAFIVNKEQYRDPRKWYDGLFSQWDMSHRVLRGPDDKDGLNTYILSCDDPGLCKAPYIAAKNMHYPKAEEIAAVEYYLKNFFWGKQQMTDKEAYPYAVYGIDDWKINRESGPDDRNGWTGHLWRVLDYPHVIHLYWSMYRVAKYYPSLCRYLNADGYLERAYGTAMAFFTVPLKLAGWSANDIGNYDEVVIPMLLNDLEAAGRRDWAARLRSEWEKKVEHFVKERPNLFHSEFPFDPTGFESHQAFAGYAARQLRNPARTLKVTEGELDGFVKEELTGNIATRGWLETNYYLLGGERGLRYTSQMGGWALLDNALYQSDAPAPLLRLGYASLLSSWVLINCGPASVNYGYWNPGPENDGAAGSGFIQEAWGSSWIAKEQPRGPWIYDCEADLGFGGALRGAAVILTDDPLFGLFAYAGELVDRDGAVEIVPRDGVRKRFHVVRGSERLHVELERDGFAAEKPLSLSADGRQLTFILENRSGDNHETALTVASQPAGKWQVTVNGKSLSSFSADRDGKTVLLPVSRDGKTTVRLERKGD